MSLDPTSRESNLRDSIIKFFVDNIYTTEGIEVSFDKGLARPKIQGQPIEVEKWVIINFGAMEMSALSSHQIQVFCCSRRDNEGFKLAQLRDKVMGYLTDSTQTDGFRRINLYQSQTWTKVGGILITDIIESQQFESEDETKYKILSCSLRWASKI